MDVGFHKEEFHAKKEPECIFIKEETVYVEPTKEESYFQTEKEPDQEPDPNTTHGILLGEKNVVGHEKDLMDLSSYEITTQKPFNDLAIEINRKSNLQGYHLLTHSSKYWKCSECEYRTSNKIYFKMHLPIHSDKHLKCSECEYRTSENVCLNRHLLTHSNKELKCSECNYRTNENVDLEKHLLTFKMFRMWI